LSPTIRLRRRHRHICSSSLIYNTLILANTQASLAFSADLGEFPPSPTPSFSFPHYSHCFNYTM
jgi:hypothetical protein